MVLPNKNIINQGRYIMEHNPFITLNDNTEITYSDLKINKNGEEYITLYFETPAGGNLGYAFYDATIDYPISNGNFHTVNHYSKEQLKNLMYYYNKLASVAFELAKEEELECHNF